MNTIKRKRISTPSPNATVSILQKINNLVQVGRAWFYLNQNQLLELIMACLKDKTLNTNSIIIEVTFSVDNAHIKKVKIIEHCHLQISFCAFDFDDFNELMMNASYQRNLSNTIQIACHVDRQAWII